MGQQPSTLLSVSDTRSEDNNEIETSEFLGTHKSKLGYEDSREKKKLRRDEAQKILEKEEEKNSQTSEEEKSKQGDV